MSETKYLKLRTGDGQFYDRELSVHIRGGEIVPIPDAVPAGSLTARHLATAGLIYASPEEVAAYFSRELNATEGHGGAEKSGPDNDSAESSGADELSPKKLAEARDQIIERRIETLVDGNTLQALRDTAANMGLEFSGKAAKQKLAMQIAVAEWQREHEK